jgi:hypothetical protein
MQHTGKLNAAYWKTPALVEVAKVIVMANMSENPELRYALGDDATAMFRVKKTMSDAEFGNLMKKQFLSQ